MLAPVAAAIGMIGLGAIGATIDYGEESPFKAMILLAKDFFATIADILNTLRSELFEV